MKLYKNYKEELEKQKKEAADRTEIEVDEKVVIIYEESTAVTALKEGSKKVFTVILFILLLASLGGGTIYLLYRLNV